jgi:hypothetical protein
MVKEITIVPKNDAGKKALMKGIEEDKAIKDFTIMRKVILRPFSYSIRFNRKFQKVNKLVLIDTIGQSMIMNGCNIEDFEIVVLE